VWTERALSQRVRTPDVEMSGVEWDVVFLCTQNSCRSQMAEAWTRTIWGDAVRVASAGVRLAACVNPYAVEAMRECGINMDAQSPKLLDSVCAHGCGEPAGSGIQCDRAGPLLVSVCAGAADACPLIPGRTSWRRVHVPFDDPPALATGMTDPMPVYRRVRDEIRAFVQDQLPTLVPIPPAAGVGCSESKVAEKGQDSGNG
jgi:arsenate reductase (thioredoxin)